jgi:hypothetical protein
MFPLVGLVSTTCPCKLIRFHESGFSYFCIHELVAVLCAHARVGSSHARLGTSDVAFVGVGADWGGTEGIGAELRSLTTNLSKLKDPTCPSDVLSFLDQRRQNVMREWILTCGYYARETFLGKSNPIAFRTLVENSSTGLRDLRQDALALTVGQLGGPWDSALLSHALADSAVSPWRRALARHGLHRGDFRHFDVASSLVLCLANLTDIERHAANGEVLGISLLLEDITVQVGVLHYLPLR